VIYLIVLGFAAAGIAAMLFFCEESNAGKAFRAIRKDPLLAQSQGINVSASKSCASGRSIPALTTSGWRNDASRSASCCADRCGASLWLFPSAGRKCI
jgi:hypothetical protein